MTATRKPNGTFAVGNPGGPGRPPRATERIYLETLYSAIPVDAWQKVVEKALADAQAGDEKARAWIEKFVLGSNPMSLTSLAMRERIGIEPEHELQAEVENATFVNETDRLLQSLAGQGVSVFERSLQLATGEGKKSHG